jgi:hypothetical protein
MEDADMRDPAALAAIHGAPALCPPAADQPLQNLQLREPSVNAAFDVMVDLETLGDGPGCVILSIGAVAFDPLSGVIGGGFYSVVDTASCVVAGLRYDQGTLDWWAKQSAEARAVIADAASGSAPPLAHALDNFSFYLTRFGGVAKARVWGNGADFDNAILAYAAKAVQRPKVWEHWNSRCYRTLKNLNRDVPMPERVGVFHNALDDAKTQAMHAVAILGRPDPHVGAVAK